MSETIRLPRRGFLRGDVAAYGVLLAITCGWLWIGTLPFVHVDDPHFIVNNPYVREGISWRTIQWAFTTSFGDYWHPLTWISLALDSTLFGTAAWGYHLTNAVLHIANGLLVYALLRAMTGDVWRSLLAAVLFSIHPQRVESVAWVTERKDVLAGFFGLLAFLTYVQWVRAPRAGIYLVVFVCFLCSLLSKPMLVMFPVLLLVLDCWPLGRWRTVGVGKLVREKVPLFLLSFAAGVNTVMYVGGQGAFRGSAWSSAKNCAVNYFLYVRDFFYPRRLGLFYRSELNVPLWEVGAAAGVMAGISVFQLVMIPSRSNM